MNLGDRIGRVLVFPDSHHSPSSRSQRAFVCEVTSAIRIKFVSPPLSICLRKGGVLGTSVPKATIDEYGHASAWENDVGLASKIRDRAAVLEEAESGAVQCRP